MRLQFYFWHRQKPMISIIYGKIRLKEPALYICPLCGKVVFESFYDIKTHYWGETKNIEGMEKVNRIQCKNNKCKAMFTTYREI
jgi:hypothetical protein